MSLTIPSFQTDKRIFLIYGPTASGKTSLAISLAKEWDAVIINADSMQLFDDLPILTARPLEKEQAGIVHHLFGILEPFEQPTVMDWIEKLNTLLTALSSTKKIILVGGTGFYLNAFLNGLSPIPIITPAIKERVRDCLYTLKDDFHDFVINQDPLIRGYFHPNDTKRLSRALAVFFQTNQSITIYYNKPVLKSLRESTFNIYVHPQRGELYEGIEKRFHLMLKNGAIEQVQAFLKRHENAVNMPVFNALGARQIADYLSSKINYEDMVLTSIQKTRQYAKRQYTWFNNQIKADYSITN